MDTNDISKGVKLVAEYIDSFFGKTIYGKIIAEKYKEHPEKYATATFINNNKIKGVISYITPRKTFMQPNPKNILIKFKLLAGDKEQLEFILNEVMPKNSEFKIDVPEGLKDYILTLKSVGFKEQSYRYSNDLRENLIILSK